MMALLLTAALAAPSVQVVKAPLPVWDVDARDLNGDGLLEVIAICADPDSIEKQIAVFSADPPNGRYGAAPAATLVIEERSSTAFFAEVDGAAPSELIVANAGGATVYSYTASGFLRGETVSFSSLFPGVANEPVILEKSAMDLDGDGVDEWLIPTPDGYSIRHATNELAAIRSDVVSSMRDGASTIITHRLPQIHAYDLPDQPQKALAFLSDEYADFAHGPNWAAQQRFKIPLTLEENWDAQPQMEDIDANGLPDLVVTQTQGTVNVKVLTQIYLATAPFTYPAAPSASFSANGSFATPMFVDVDGNEKKDLVLVKVPYGLKMFANLFLRRKVNIQAEVHLFRDGGYPQTANFVSYITLDAPEGKQKIAYTMGDFTGDGRMDAAFGMGANHFAIHDGGPDRFLSEKPWQTIDVPTFGEARTHNLNAGAAEEIVLFHPDGGSQAQQIEIIFFD